MIAAIAALSYGARLSSAGDEGLGRDFLFRWSTALFTYAFDGLVLLLMLVIARGLPSRCVRAAPPTVAVRMAHRAALLRSIYAASFAAEIFIVTAARAAVPHSVPDPRRRVYLDVIAIALSSRSLRQRCAAV